MSYSFTFFLVLECHSVIVLECHSVKVSECHSVRVSELFVCLPVSERGDNQSVGVTEIFKAVVKCGVDHLELNSLVHPVISATSNIK